MIFRSQEARPSLRRWRIWVIVATGWYDSLTTVAQAAFAAVEVSGAWQRGDDVQPPPASPGHGARLAAVTCARGGGCLVVGSYQSALRCFATVRYGLFLPGAGATAPPVPAGSPVMLALTWSHGHRAHGHRAQTAGVRQPASAGEGGPDLTSALRG